MRCSQGFTLGEMIIVIVILGIMGSAFGAFIVPAVLANRDLERHAPHWWTRRTLPCGA
jgi:prepilin-type N-terminal cleavage/methylation domain-containing protein